MQKNPKINPFDKLRVNSEQGRTIKTIKAREILDSKGTPTIEVDLTTEKGFFRASVPSGVSRSSHEAVELRDGGERYEGQGVLKAVENINTIIAPKLESKEVTNQREIDQILIELDGTENKSHLGANSLLAVSLAVCRAGAKEKGLALYRYISQLAGSKPCLPVPCLLMIEGGLHAGNELNAQEFMISVEAGSFREKLRIGTEIYHILAEILEAKYGKSTTNVGYEGGFTVPMLKKSEEVLDLFIRAIAEADYSGQIKIILDMAASTFYRDGFYYLEGEKLDKKGLLDFYEKIIEKYPIFAIEDPYAEDDNEGFKMMAERFGKKLVIIGDDFLTTNIERIKKAASEKTCNGLVLKPNQVGTVTETIEAAKEALNAQWKVFVKHRGGETNDDFIADLAVGLGTGWIMAGAPARGERLAKYNQLLRIEEEINKAKS